jgi:tRNA acetyltransferase TAN1
MCYEMVYLLKEVGDAEAKADKTGIRGVIVAKTSLEPVEAMEKFRGVLQEKPYEFRYALRILPIQRVVHTDLEDIKKSASEFAAQLQGNETFRVTVEKRFTSIHSRDIIEAIASDIKNTVDLKNPDKIFLIEIVGGFTGMSLVKPSDVLSVQKEKML